MKHYLILIMLLPIVLAANVYTLDQLIEYGLGNSFQIQRAELSNNGSQSSLRSAKWNLVPEANLFAGMNQDLDPISGNSDLTSNTGFEIRKNISLNDAAYFNYRYANLDAQTADMELEQSYSSYAYQVFQAYVETLSATKRKSALEENLAIQNRVWEQSKVLLRLGKTTTFEVKQNEIAVMNSQISIIQLENTIENARSRLFALVQIEDLGYPLAELEIEIDKSVPEFSTEDMRELKILKQELKRNEINLKQNFLNHFPTTSLGYSYSRQVSGPDFDFDTYNTVHGVSLNLSYSLWNLFTNREEVTRAKINQQLAELSISDKIDTSRRDYDNIRKELTYLLRLDELYSERLQQSTEQIRIAEERYRLGLIQLLELDKTRTDYIAADIEFNANRYQIISKQEALNFLLSKQILGKW
ncbi:MAG: outer membrane protein [Candidatus Cloacimonadota bacterium]|nr:outer membrane protein [Candidatus Cloacimonadota bacterium]